MDTAGRGLERHLRGGGPLNKPPRPPPNLLASSTTQALERHLGGSNSPLPSKCRRGRGVKSTLQMPQRQSYWR